MGTLHTQIFWEINGIEFLCTDFYAYAQNQINCCCLSLPKSAFENILKLKNGLGAILKYYLLKNQIQFMVSDSFHVSSKYYQMKIIICSWLGTDTFLTHIETSAASTTGLAIDSGTDV